MTSDPTIDYEALQQDAMRSVVRAVLMRAAESGLPGDHHFYISFDTQAPGVIVSKRLRESPKYQHEMTIVLQHRFWDLVVSDQRFEVKLTFDGIPERLVVPFTAIKVFFDPSVRYGLQFEDLDQPGDAGTDALANQDPGPDAPLGNGLRPTTTRSQGPRKPRTPRKTRVADRETAAPPTSATAPAPPTSTTSVPAVPPAQPVKPVAAPPTPARLTPAEPAPAQPSAAGAQIVSLDQFRKK